MTLAIFPVCCTVLDLARNPTKWNNISEKSGNSHCLAWSKETTAKQTYDLLLCQTQIQARPTTGSDSLFLLSHQKIQIWGLIQHLSEALCALLHISTTSSYLPGRHPVSPGALSELIAAVWELGLNVPVSSRHLLHFPGFCVHPRQMSPKQSGESHSTHWRREKTTEEIYAGWNDKLKSLTAHGISGSLPAPSLVCFVYFTHKCLLWQVNTCFESLQAHY